MDTGKLYNIRVCSGMAAGSLINELLPSIGLCPSAYFDDETKMAQLDLYYEDQAQCKSDFLEVKKALARWSDIAEVDLSAVDLTLGELKKEDWSEKWKEFFGVEKVSERLVIKPSWEEYVPCEGEVVVEIDPGMSFGTGNHGTTKACLQLLDGLSQSVKDSFLDMGCGSGILSIAASKLGIEKVDGFDYDEDSVRIARENVRRSRCENVSLQRQDLYDFEAEFKYTLVVANILAPVLLDNCERIVASLAQKKSARLVLSGILHEQFSQVQQLFESHGLGLVESIRMEQWSTGLFKLTP